MNMSIINNTHKITNQRQQELSLKPGQIIDAQVVKSEGSQVLLQLNSNLLKAQTKLPLNPGDRLKLQVETAQHNYIELKIVNDAARLKPDDAILLRMGLKPQEEMNTILRQLVKFNLPVSTAAIMELYSLSKGNKFSAEMSQLVVWLKSVGVKAESEKDLQSLEALLKFFKGEMSSQEETGFFSFINTTENNLFGGFNLFGWPLGNNHIYLVIQGPKSERPQSENCKLFLKIDSQSMEELWFKIEHVNNHLEVNIICSSDQYRQILEREVGLLQNLLQSAGYQINALPIEVRETKPTILDLISGAGQEIANINYEV